MKKIFKFVSLSPNMGTSRILTDKPPSLVTPGGSTSLKQPMQYTCTNMLGIATMHKSNAVPVFSDQSAKDISQMRR